jgi:hypothetical protein
MTPGDHRRHGDRGTVSARQHEAPGSSLTAWGLSVGMGRYTAFWTGGLPSTPAVADRTTGRIGPLVGILTVGAWVTVAWFFCLSMSR